MKTSKALKASTDFSIKASDSSRQLAFAGIAVVWLLSGNKISELLTVELLKWALFLFSVSLLIDLVHYFVGGIIWKAVYEIGLRKRTSDKSDPDVNSGFLNWVLYFFYFCKIGAVASGFVCVLKYLFAG